MLSKDNPKWKKTILLVIFRPALLQKAKQDG
jgi:hypothetical protein